MKQKNLFFGAAAVCFLVFLFSAPAYGEEIKPRKFTGQDVIGEAFDKPVTSQDFFYYFKTASMFSRSGKEKRDEDDIRQEAWENLVFLQGAKELGITISREDLEKELKRLVGEKEVEYGTPQYQLWTVTEIGDDPATFERRIEDLLTVNKLMQMKANAEVTVTPEEMKQKYLNEYNSFESEYIRFDTPEEAQAFLEKVKKDKALWKKTYDEKKAAGQKGAAWINGMSLEALIDLWKIPKEDAYRILAMKPGDFIVAKFFYGDAVFRVLSKREADLSKYDEKKQQYYKDMLTMVKKRKISQEYFGDLIKRAAVRDYVLEDKQAKKVEDMKKKSVVTLETTKGTVKIRLFPEKAPMAVENFVTLAEQGYFNGLIFHRVIKDFMIQGGDPTGTGGGGKSIWDMPFGDEIDDSLTFDKPGMLAMANSGPNSNLSQFFITVKPTPWLNKKHTIFGEVIEGMDVVQAIDNVPTNKSDKPLEDQKIIKVSVLGEAKK